MVSLCLDLLGLSCMALARSSGQVWWCGELSEGVHGQCVACMPPLHHLRLLAFFNLRSKRNWLNRGEIKISSGVVKPNADFGRFQMKIKLKSDLKSNTKSARTRPTKSTLKTPIAIKECVGEIKKLWQNDQQPAFDRDIVVMVCAHFQLY